ncbi:MAG: hypothetical protein LBJ24_00175 [Treponema sp.]|nr:hypothetical protein [Treponema sp.]
MYGIPYSVFDSLPLGIVGVMDFFNRLASSISVDKEGFHDFLHSEEETCRYFLKSLADTYYENSLQKNTILVGDTGTVSRLGSFLPKTIGTIIHASILTDLCGQNNETPPRPPPKNLNGDVYHTGDSGQIEQIISGANAEMILGSFLEAKTAENLKIPHLTVSAPNGNQVLLHKTYSGIAGAYFLLEDYASAILRHNSEQRREKRMRLENLNHLHC